VTTRKPVNPDHAPPRPRRRDARRAREEREQGYRAQALKLFPWICGRCAREFDQRQRPRAHGPPQGPQPRPQPARRQQLGIACLYCHDNEHQRYLEEPRALTGSTGHAHGATHLPFADLAGLLKRDE